MEIIFTIGQDDTLPVWTYQIKTANGPINLTGCTVQLAVGAVPPSTPIFEAPATVVTATQGIVSFSFTAAQTAIAGIFEVWFVVSNGTGGVEHWPNDGQLYIQITPTEG